jgi:glycopeptide antibiotics resistance protein
LRRLIAVILLVIYLVVLLDLVLFQFPVNHPPPNLTPFRSMVNDWHLGGGALLINFLGNLVAFAPLGLLLPLVRPGGTSAWRVVLTAAALSGSIELAQYVSGRRVADVDDIALNALGALLGYGALVAFRAFRARWAGRGG